MDDLYCKLFIDSKLSYSEIFNYLVFYLNGTSNHITIINSSWCEICLKFNDYYSDKEYNNAPKDFVFWPYYLEIYNNFSESRVYIQNIRKLIEALHEICNGVVASCDFEELL